MTLLSVLRGNIYTLLRYRPRLDGVLINPPVEMFLFELHEPSNLDESELPF